VLLYFYWNQVTFSKLCVRFVLSPFVITNASLSYFLSITVVLNSDIFVE
jgi:hypothetical protein